MKACRLPLTGVCRVLYNILNKFGNQVMVFAPSN